MLKRVSVLLQILVLMISLCLNAQEQKGVKVSVIPFEESKFEFKFENQWAFFIGINNYAHINDLEHPVSETRKIENLLIDKYGFLPSKKKLWHDLRRVEHLYSELATYYAIRDRLYWYSKNLEEDDSLFVYFSGHGYVDRNGNAYWLPHDVTSDVRYKYVYNEAIENSELKISLDQIMVLLDSCKARHVFVVMDACYSGAGKILFSNKSPLLPPPSPETRQLMKKKSRQILVAGMGKVPDPSPFSRFIINFLGDNSKPYLLASNIIEKTMLTLKDVIKPKGGHIWHFDKGQGEFVFTLSNYVAINVSAAQSYYELGYNSYVKKQFEKAIYYYMRAIEENPADFKFYNNMAVAYIKLGEKRKAIETLLEAVKINPDYATAYYNLGYLYEELKDYQTAIHYYKEAIKIDPNFTDAYNNMGVAYYRSGKFSEALEAFKKTVEIDPLHSAASYNLADVYKRMGKIDEAKEVIRIYKKLIRSKK